MTAYELYKALEKKFEEDPTAKELPVFVPDNECGEYKAEGLKWRPYTGWGESRRDILVIDYD